MRKIVPALVALLLLLAACGGTDATPNPTSPATSASPADSGSSVGLVEGATTALKTAHDAWQFTVTTYELGAPSVSRMIAGTQTVKPATALSFTVTEPGKPDLRYVRVGTDVWYDTGAGSYTTSKASDNYVNLAFQSFYLDSIVGAAETQGYEFDTVGPDTVSGVATTHYRLADEFIQGIVASMAEIAPADWAADVWTADADGSLMRITWGPQSLDKAQPETGFDYTVTSLDCDCPVLPPGSRS